LKNIISKLEKPFLFDFIYVYCFLLADFISTHLAINLKGLDWGSEANPFIRILAITLGPFGTLIWPLIMFFIEYLLFKALNEVNNPYISLAFASIIASAHLLAVLLWLSTLIDPLLQFMYYLMQINGLFPAILVLSISIIVLSLIHEAAQRE